MGYPATRAVSLFSQLKATVVQNKLVSVFVTTHLLFAIFLGRLFALAPDEGGYLYTFNNLYGSKDPNPQSASGWIVAPKPFLWITYLPAKVLNLLGVPDYLSIRILSISIATLSLILLIKLQRRGRQDIGRQETLIFLFFFTPSIFLWTSVGLREVFILAEISLVVVGLHYLFQGDNVRAISYIFLGSYALLSTKNYLWICLVLSVLVLTVMWILLGVSKRKLLNLSLALILLPCIAFASTTSVYALEFLLTSVVHSDLASTGSRTGDSTIQVAIPQNSTNGSNSPDLPGQSGNPKPNEPRIVTFHGDTTLILLHSYLVDNPKAIFSRVLNALGITSKIQEIWDSKVKSGLVKKTAKELPDSSSLSGYILKPGKLHQPLSILRPAFLFLFGPIPFLDQGGIALNTVALESPIWWLLYALVIFSLIRYRRNDYWKDSVFQLSAIYFVSLVAISALVEVNLGTSFRHRSILFIPLIVMFIRTRNRPPVVVD